MNAFVRTHIRLAGLGVAFGVLLAASLPASAAILQGSWRLDETSGTTALDSSPFARHGSYINTPNNNQAPPAPVFGRAYGFDIADGDGINVGTDFNFANDFTITAWINHAQPPSTFGFIFTHVGGGSGYGFRVENGNLKFTTFGILDYASTAVVPAGVWTHVAVVFDANNDANFYVNGVLIDTVAGALPAVTTGTGDFHIAERNPFFYGGLIDEVNIFTGSLTAGEIGALMVRQTLPEPATSALLLAGLGLLSRSRRR